MGSELITPHGEINVKKVGSSSVGLQSHSSSIISDRVTGMHSTRAIKENSVDCKALDFDAKAGDAQSQKGNQNSFLSGLNNYFRKYTGSEKPKKEMSLAQKITKQLSSPTSKGVQVIDNDASSSMKAVMTHSMCNDRVSMIQDTP